MIAPHYVCSDVPSEVSDAWMIYYTHHNQMAALHYVCVDVSLADF
jgi:hypothetical protein